MTKADKQIIKTLQNIQKHCEKMDECKLCRFGTEWQCQLTDLAYELFFHRPNCWNMEEIKRIITNNDV